MAGRTKCTLMFIICRQRLCLLTHSTMVLPQVESLKEALKSKSRMHEPCVALFPFQHFIFGQGLSVNLECLIAPIYRARRGKLDRLRPPSDHRRSGRRATLPDDSSVAVPAARTLEHRLPLSMQPSPKQISLLHPFGLEDLLTCWAVLLLEHGRQD